MMKKILIIQTIIMQIIFANPAFEEATKFDITKDLLSIKMTQEMIRLSEEYQQGNQYSGYELATKLYDKGHYNQSGEILTSLITEKDVPEAFTLLGEHFMYGRGVDKDCFKAGIFYSGGVSSGDCNAYLKIHDQYQNGICVPVNKYKSKKYLKANKTCLENQAKGIVKAKKVGNKMVIQ